MKFSSRQLSLSNLFVKIIKFILRGMIYIFLTPGIIIFTIAVLIWTVYDSMSDVKYWIENNSSKILDWIFTD